MAIGDRLLKIVIQGASGPMVSSFSDISNDFAYEAKGFSRAVIEGGLGDENEGLPNDGRPAFKRARELIESWDELAAKQMTAEERSHEDRMRRWFGACQKPRFTVCRKPPRLQELKDLVDNDEDLAAMFRENGWAITKTKFPGTRFEGLKLEGIQGNDLTRRNQLAFLLVRLVDPDKWLQSFKSISNQMGYAMMKEAKPYTLIDEKEEFSLLQNNRNPFREVLEGVPEFADTHGMIKFKFVFESGLFEDGLTGDKKSMELYDEMQQTYDTAMAYFGKKKGYDENGRPFRRWYPKGVS